MNRLAAAALTALLIAACGGPVPASPAISSSAPVATAIGTAALASAAPSAEIGAGPATAAATGTSVPAAAPTSTPAPPVLVATILGVHLPTHLSRMVVFVDGGVLVVCGGWNGTGTTGVIIRVDPAAGTIVTAGKLAVAVHDAAGAQMGDLWLVLGGGGAAPDASVQVVERFGAAKVVGQLPAARADLVVATVGASAIVAGGAGSGPADPSVLATVDGVSFNAFATLPVPVRYPGVAVLGGKVYLFGGETASGETATIQVIDPLVGTAREAGLLPATLSHAMAFVLGDRIYLAGGRHAGAALRDIRAWDPVTGQVTAAGQLPATASDGVAAVIGTKAYIVGGERDQVLDTVVAVGAEG